jgi:hypothetical protein
VIGDTIIIASAARKRLVIVAMVDSLQEESRTPLCMPGECHRNKGFSRVSDTKYGDFCCGQELR